MDKLKKTIEQYGRWTALSDYIDRIEAHVHTDFSNALENAKALLEAVSKEICKAKGLEIDDTLSINAVLKKAFNVLGYANDSMVPQISSALATIGQQMGNLRNEIGTISHGKSLEELRERNNKVDEITKEFLVDTTVIVACFLIRTFENKNQGILHKGFGEKLLYEDNEAFNEFLDDEYGEFNMGEYSYPASEILFNVDSQAYLTAQKAFSEGEEKK